MSANPPSIAEVPFHTYLQERLESGVPSTDEVLSVVLPLFRQVQTLHARGKVAPLVGLNALKVTNEACWFTEAAALNPRTSATINEIEKVESKAILITGRQDIRDTDEGARKVRDLLIGMRGEKIVRPVFLPGYVSWEHEVEHHDQLTDIFSLGLITASLACGLDLSQDDELESFVSNRANLFHLHSRLHPVLAKAIGRMSDPYRRQRVQDLPALIDTLTHYRLQVSVPDLDFNRIAGFKEAAHKDRGKIIQQRLRDRLFEISRRNRLIYFRPTMQMLNLTVASVPLMLDYKHIAPDTLCTWQGDFAKSISNGDSVQLGKYMRFEDAPYLPGVLDQIRNQELRDRNEYGFSQLRMVLSFLRWHNLKDVKEERITSPLVLLPVAVEKKKGVRDSYTLTPLTTEAEFNPVLRYHLRQVYGLQLPEIIDLSQTSLQAFFELLQKQIQASEPGITLRKLDKPQIKLVHERARARVELFRKRSRLTGRGVRTIGSVDYSYSRENFQPLGLQLFLKKVKPSPIPLQDIAGEAPKPRFPNMVAPKEDDKPEAGVRERDMYVLQQESEANPYVWDFDLCSLTLGNFNYRKMSLVRDYNTLLEGEFPNPAFDSVFSLHPRKANSESVRPLPPRDAFQIVSSDPTQMAAVTRARTGASYIIQGPPGTGKSQTITNLIADYVGRGKRVLFVCEKRAAIDVVFHRLKQRGLDKHCCLIHDSQADKKAFIQDLKGTYEGYLAAPDAKVQTEETREQIVKQMQFELDALERFAAAMAHVEARDGIPLRQIYVRLIELAAQTPEVTDADAEKLPTYSVWNRFGQSVHALARVLTESGGEPIFAKNPLRHLARPMIEAERPIEAITQAIDAAANPLEELLRIVRDSGLPPNSLRTLGDVLELVSYAERVKLLTDTAQTHLLNAQDAGVRKLQDAVAKRKDLLTRKTDAAKKTTHWREKIPAEEVQTVLEQARGLEDSFLRFIFPSFWKLRGILRARYDFTAHVVAPKWSRILEDLKAEYQATDTFTAEDQTQRNYYRTDDIEVLAESVSSLHAGEASLRPAQRALREKLLGGSADSALISKLLGAGPLAKAVNRILEPLLLNHADRQITQIAADLEGIRSALPLLPDLLPILTDLLSAPSELYRALCERALSPDALEAAVLQAALLRAYRRDRSLPRIDGRVLAQHVERIKQNYREWMEINAKLILERAHAHFLERANLSNVAAAQLSPEQKELKRIYSKGRRELEHEFSKVMRYRSIRDLADDETGYVVADLKPIWLMSPLSVSDTLPITGTTFDVVIFDEASQIPLEEAIPALYRAPQIIVVGDEKQLPPTDFFASKAGDADEEEPTADVEAEGLGYDLNSDSFLTQSAENLPATMLCWHYRSRSESLISFSNASFYGHKLLTVPDVRLNTASKAIEAMSPEVGDTNHTQIIDRPISFHYLPNGLYRDRRNSDEAAYIARMVRGLLKAKTGMSIGLVAFSEAQQGEIETALTLLSMQDSEFDELLQAEYEREEDEQFCGLFVKNLENVQGDERDIIIMSVCYGYDDKKRMLMNFGPINKSGGEKRLNVVFSRARKHMALVSSIRSSAITNEYNDGANCLKRYIAYAEALSSGQAELARRILATAAQDTKPIIGNAAKDALSQSIVTELKKRGFDADQAVGQSDFRCDVAIRKVGADRFSLGVLIDRDLLDKSSDALEQSLLRPEVLKSFGWRILRITAKDWHHDRASVLAQIDRELIEA